jgi:hypothetical protein
MRPLCRTALGAIAIGRHGEVCVTNKSRQAGEGEVLSLR